MATRTELKSVLAWAYGMPSRVEKGRILDELLAVTGFHWKHAMRFLRSGPDNGRIAGRRNPCQTDRKRRPTTILAGTRNTETASLRSVLVFSAAAGHSSQRPAILARPRSRPEVSLAREGVTLHRCASRVVSPGIAHLQAILVVSGNAFWRISSDLTQHGSQASRRSQLHYVACRDDTKA